MSPPRGRAHSSRSSSSVTAGVQPPRARRASRCAAPPARGTRQRSSCWPGSRLRTAVRSRRSRLAQRAVDTIPLPQFVATPGDLQRRVGRIESARRQAEVVSAISRSLDASGVRTDLETAVFDLDHGIAARGGPAARARTRTGRAPVDRTATTRSGGRSPGTGAARRRWPGAAVAAARDARRVALLPSWLCRAAARGPGCDARTWYRRALALDPHFSVVLGSRRAGGAA